MPIRETLICLPIRALSALPAFAAFAALLAGEAASARPLPRDYPYQELDFRKVKVKDHFWARRLALHTAKTLPHVYRTQDSTGRIRNFDRAAGVRRDTIEGLVFNDSDMYKLLEGMLFAYALNGDPALKARIDSTAARILAAQEPDGYISPFNTVNKVKRWANPFDHVDYSMGHFMEFGIAHALVTGESKALEAAKRAANRIRADFNPVAGPLRYPPVHEGLSLGLTRLYAATGERTYLDLAKGILDERGNFRGHSSFSVYWHDSLPILRETKAHGHAVSHAYMMSAVLDVAAYSGAGEAAGYLDAAHRIWNSALTKMHVTGGIGGGFHEAYPREDYRLPLDEAYNETCASIAFMMWNLRMYRAFGDAKYFDLIERTLYNAFLSGTSLSGDRFFYVNQIQSGGNARFPIHANTNCCPPNISRWIPMVAGLAYGKRGDELHANMFLDGEAQVDLATASVRVVSETEYPWKGLVRYTLFPSREGAAFAFRIRIPGWVRGRPVPGDVYRYPDSLAVRPTLRLNGKEIPAQPDAAGYVEIKRAWSRGETVSLHLPMVLRRTYGGPRVAATQGKVALEVGPIVYAAEGADNGGQVLGKRWPADQELRVSHRRDMLGGVNVVTGKLPGGNQTFLAVPYYTWCNRGSGQMAVWLPREDFRGGKVVVGGCRDPRFEEYNPLAVEDDGSCRTLPATAVRALPRPDRVKAGAREYTAGGRLVRKGAGEEAGPAETRQVEEKRIPRGIYFPH